MKKTRVEMAVMEMTDMTSEMVETMTTAMAIKPTTMTDIKIMSATAVAEKVGNVAKLVAKINLEDNVEMETGNHNKGK